MLALYQINDQIYLAKNLKNVDAIVKTAINYSTATIPIRPNIWTWRAYTNSTTKLIWLSLYGSQKKQELYNHVHIIWPFYK